MKLIDGSLVMCHKHLACALVEQREISKTSSGPDRILQHAPEAFNRVEVVPTMGWEAMEAQLVVVGLKGRVELVRPMQPTAIDDHHDLFVGVAEGGHPWMEIWAQLLGSKVGHDCIKDFRGAILDGADNAQEHAAGDAAPRAIL